MWHLLPGRSSANDPRLVPSELQAAKVQALAGAALASAFLLISAVIAWGALHVQQPSIELALLTAALTFALPVILLARELHRSLAMAWELRNSDVYGVVAMTGRLMRFRNGVVKAERVRVLCLIAPRLANFKEVQRLATWYGVPAFRWRERKRAYRAAAEHGQWLKKKD